jgi:uncharacterized protein (TIGR02594 family)
MTVPKHLVEARLDLGIKERVNAKPDGTGGELNPKVRAYFKFTKYPATLITITTAWCAAFVCACLERAGIRSPRTARAADFKNFGRAVDLEHIQAGDIVVFSPAVADAGLSGHVAIFEKWTDDAKSELDCIGGNQDNRVKVKPFARARVVAVRRPAA